MFYQTKAGKVPAETFLDECPDSVDIRINAVLKAVSDAPPPQFSGGGMWEAMHGDMAGYYEVRVRAGKDLFRLFCLLDRHGPGLSRPAIIALTGLRKRLGTAFSSREYAVVSSMGEDYRSSSPRRIKES